MKVPGLLFASLLLASANAAFAATPLEVVHQAYAAYNKGDIPALVDQLSDHVEWRLVSAAPSEKFFGVRHNKQEVTAFFASVGAADEVRSFEPREFVDGGDTVTVLGHELLESRSSHKRFEADWVHVVTVKDGKITRWLGYTGAILPQQQVAAK